MDEEIDWREPWAPTSNGDALVAELNRELCPAHVLYGRDVVAIGRRVDQDDVLFKVLENPPSFAVVHLTWTGKVEADPAWPGTEIFKSVEDFIDQCMIPDSRVRRE